ncbi:MAG: hypothetical protein MUF84_11720 [Anaerolineae bacterium]|nr:hypothetical protein [Anaerolineae bacterium]
MTVVLGISLVVLGLALWIAAGLLPVFRLQSRGRGSTDATLDLTWMGVVKLRRRLIGGITGARLGRDSAQVELATRDGWVPLALPKVKPQLTPAQLTGIIDHYAKETAPPKVLALPLRDRLSTMVAFALLFPLGTICVFAGALLATRA